MWSENERLLFILMDVRRKRGRPKGSKTNREATLSINKDDEQLLLVRSMNSIMDSQWNWMFNYVRKTIKADHMRRTVIEEAIKRGKFGEDVWNAEQDKISELWHKIKSLRYSEHFDMNEKCQVDKDIIDNITMAVKMRNKYAK